MSQDTVLGQGSSPDPEDETYLSLIKGTYKRKGIRVKVKKENAGVTTPYGSGASPPDHDRETYTNLLKDTVKVKKVKVKKEEKSLKRKQDEELEKHKTTINIRKPSKDYRQAEANLTPSYIGGQE